MRLKLPFLIGAALLLLAGGLVVFQFGQPDTEELVGSSQSWSSVSGLITQSNLSDDEQMTVNYEYIVDDERFENDRVRFDQEQLSLWRTRKCW